MGYRSDVKLITTKEGWAKLSEAVKQYGDDEYGSITDCETTELVGGKYVLAEWDEVKWYEGYNDEVDAFMDELRKFDDKGIPYSYKRIGEDDTDIDAKDYGGGDDWEKYEDMPELELVRSIKVWYPGE